MANPTQISFFEIVNERGWAAYNYRVDVAVAGDYKAQIQRVVDSGMLPRGGRKPHRHPVRAERFLDIHEARGDGEYAYAFYLNAAVGGEQRLLFKKSMAPFQVLTMNSGGSEDFLADLTVYSEGADGARWASFVCNLSTPRGGGLATRIKTLPGHHPPYTMTIPFSFSLIDPKLQASPWVMPGNGDEDDGHHQLDGPAALDPGITHGGVHPSAASYLSIPL